MFTNKINHYDQNTATLTLSGAGNEPRTISRSEIIFQPPRFKLTTLLSTKQ